MLKALLAILRILFTRKPKLSPPVSAPKPPSVPTSAKPVLVPPVQPSPPSTPPPAPETAPAPVLVVWPDYVRDGIRAQGEVPEFDNLPKFSTNFFRGYTGQVTEGALRAFCLRTGVGLAALKAVVRVESLGRAFDTKTSLPIVLDEGHQFGKLTDYVYSSGYPTLSWRKWGEIPYRKTQAERWELIGARYVLDKSAALSSVSWGMFQIMGFNWKACGCLNLNEFIDTMLRGEDAQLHLFEAFIRNFALNRTKTGHANLLSALKAEDWLQFARYNGTGQMEKYSVWLKAAHDKELALAAAATLPTPGPKPVPNPWS